ncbi:MAG: molybdate ABC transporter permease subunit [Deltaproteobacteria bacterium]|nr:molybdate ABC transporter permease subunit [Deltaproteobacteria bacterium]
MELSPLYLTIKVSITATFFTAAIGLVVALLMARKDFPGKTLLDIVIMQPLVIPPTVLGYYILTVFGKSGPLGRFIEDTLGLDIVFTWKGAVVAAFISSFPLFVKPARASIESVGKDLENAARLLGKTELEVLNTITLPLAWRGIAAGTVMAFARATGEFGATLMVAGNIPGLTQTLPIAIYDAVSAGDNHTANVLVAIITVFSLAVLLVAARFLKGKL